MINSEGCLGGYNLHTFTYNHESTCQNMIASKRNIEKLVKPEKIVLTFVQIFDLFWPSFFTHSGAPKWVNNFCF